MVRTQILLPEDIYEAAKLAAYQKRVSLSEIVRQSLRVVVKINIKENKEAVKSGSEILLDFKDKIKKLSGKIKQKTPKNLSSRTDYYLYGNGRIE